jgi:hypothetical protein
VSREELEAKLRGKPDFVLEDHYCAGKGAYCLQNGRLRPAGGTG